MTLTKTQILVLAATAGFTGPDQNTAAAIALAESSGNPAVAASTRICVLVSVISCPSGSAVPAIFVRPPIPVFIHLFYFFPNIGDHLNLGSVRSGQVAACVRIPAP